MAVDQATGIKMTRGRHTGSYLARSTMECDGSHGGCLRSDRIPPFADFNDSRIAYVARSAHE